MMTSISSVCPKCGTMEKSGKNSCCGRGGSWFRNCGSAGNMQLRHTWYEGIRVCKTRAQSKRASGRQSNAAQRLHSSNGVDTGKSKTVATATTVRPLCRKCGTVAKSGKISCCGRGGSWFRNCGSTGNSKLSHRWSDGVASCKRKFKVSNM